MPNTVQYVHRIDRDSTLIELSPSWVEFARKNWDPRFDPHEVLGTSLWDHISDLPTLHIFNQIINRLRADQGRAVFDFRCDSPALRRFMRMEMAGLPEGEIEFRAGIIKEEAREPVVLGEGTRERMLTMCSWCKRVRTPDWAVPFGQGLVEDSWEELELLMTPLSLADAGHLPGVSHGSCPDCRLRVMQAFDGPAYKPVI